MASRPWRDLDGDVLDLFAGGHGAGAGYQEAGARVVAVDQVERADRPAGIAFVKADVRDVLADQEFLRRFRLVHGSPPCKENTRLQHLRDAQGGTAIHPDMLEETRGALEAAGVPYVLENVEGAPMRPDVILCGSMFPELAVYDETGRRWLRRHRLFELGGWGSYGMGVQPEPCCTCLAGCGKRTCGHRLAGVRALGVYGSRSDDIPDGGQTARTLEQARELMGMPWASWASITQAIPPAYTRYLFARFLEHQAAAA